MKRVMKTGGVKKVNVFYEVNTYLSLLYISVYLRDLF